MHQSKTEISTLKNNSATCKRTRWLQAFLMEAEKLLLFLASSAAPQPTVFNIFCTETWAFINHQPVESEIWKLEICYIQPFFPHPFCPSNINELRLLLLKFEPEGNFEMLFRFISTQKKLAKMFQEGAINFACEFVAIPGRSGFKVRKEKFHFRFNVKFAQISSKICGGKITETKSFFAQLI